MDMIPIHFYMFRILTTWHFFVLVSFYGLASGRFARTYLKIIKYAYLVRPVVVTFSAKDFVLDIPLLVAETVMYLTDQIQKFTWNPFKDTVRTVW
jgi:hypothetical protein